MQLHSDLDPNMADRDAAAARQAEDLAAKLQMLKAGTVRIRNAYKQHIYCVASSA